MMFWGMLIYIRMQNAEKSDFELRPSLALNKILMKYLNEETTTITQEKLFRA